MTRANDVASLRDAVLRLDRWDLERVDIPSLGDFFYGLRTDAEGEWLSRDDVLALFASSASETPEAPAGVSEQPPEAR